ncbi:MAG: GAF domain-containing protein [Candidatus Rokubacteria bacterium]|nr:GAF domain-containing protein [Candidatus Rokubacteria bacterium]
MGREDAREKERRLETLTQVTRTLAATLSPDDVLQRVVDAAVELFEASASRLWLVDDDGEHLTLRATGGVPTSAEGGARLRIGEGLVGTVVATRAPLTVADLDIDPRTRRREQLRAEGLLSFAGVPLLGGDRVLGALAIAAQQRHEYTREEVSLLQSLADHAALAIGNARLFADGQIHQAHLTALLEINKKIGAMAPTEPLLTSIAEEAARLLDVDNAGFRLLEGDELVLAGLAGNARQTMLRPRLKIGESLSGAVVLSGKTLVTRLEGFPGVVPEHLAADRRLGYTTFLGVPLRTGDRIIGALTFRARRPFTERDRELAEAFAGQAALALTNAQLYEEADRQRREAEFLAELARTINASLDLGTVLQHVAEGARDLCRSDEARIALREPGSDTALFRYWVGSAHGHESTRLEPGKGIGGLVLVTGRPVRTNDYMADSRITGEYVPLIREEGIVAVLVVPIRTGDRVEGLLYVANHSARPFTDHDEAILMRLADQAGTAIENARLYQEAREYADRLRALEEVNRLISASLQVEEVLRSVAGAVARFFDTSYVSVWVLDQTGRRLRRSLTYGDPEFAATLTSEVAPGEGLVGWAVLHREPILWTDVERDARVVDVPRLLEAGLRFLTAYPIAIGDRVLGAFSVSRTAPTSITPETASLLGSLAAQAAVALDHARLYAETTQRLRETTALLEVAEILNSTLDSKQLLKRVAIKIAQVCAVDRCSVELWDGGRVIPLMSQFADGRKRPELWAAFLTIPPYPPRQVPAHARAIESRRPVIIEDTAETDLIPREWVDTFGLRSYMVVPMVRQDQVIGVMNLDYCDRVTPFREWQVDLAMAIAGQLALSIENTRLYAEAQVRLRETSTLLAVGHALSERGPTGEVMRRVAREVVTALGADMVGAYFLDARKESLVPLAGYHVPRDLLATFMSRPMALSRFPLLLEAWRSGRAVGSPDPLNDARFDPEWLAGLPPHSVLFVSAIAHGEPVGALFLVWWRPGREFQPAEIRLVEGVAAQVGLALENADLTRRTETKLKETEALLSVSRAVSSTVDPEAVLRHFLRSVAKAVGADSVGIWMLDEDGEWLVPLMGYHVPRERLEALRHVRISLQRHGFWAEAVGTKRPVFSRDAATDPRIPKDILSAAPHRSQLFVPIVAKERVIGGFAAVWWERERVFSSDELALMEAIANQAGVAIENARLFEENRRRVEELSALYELAQAVTGQLDRATLIDAIHTQVSRLLDARNMVIILRDDAAQEAQVALRVLDGVRDAGGTRRYPVRSVGLMSVVLETGRPLRTDNYLAECARRGVEPDPISAQMGHWLGVPMTTEDRVVGVLALRSRERAFTEADERLLGNIARLAALALRSVLLFEERTRAYGELAAAQDQLVRTEKLRALGEMASGVAHDFNNLLAAILGRAELLQVRIQDPKLRQWLQVIRRSALDGAQTVRRLQEFARVRRDQPLVAVDLNQVVRDALEITQSRWRDEPRSQGIAIEVRTVLPALPRVTGDAAELREALTNLILNAVDAMPQGGVLTLATAVVGEEVELAVTDTGIGMPESVKNQIFDPFFTTKGPQGTGLGLSMTYGIATRHRGRITVESEEGHGSTFRLALPRSEPVEAPERPPSPSPPGAGLRCLIVDDEEAVGTMLGDVLETGGHRTVVLTDGARAIAEFSAEPFDVVFTDLAMPRTSGWQVARAVKAMAPDVPVFLVTGFGVELPPDDLLSRGVDAVLAKPLKIQEILDAAAQAARRRAHTNRPGGH